MCDDDVQAAGTSCGWVWEVLFKESVYSDNGDDVEARWEERGKR